MCGTWSGSSTPARSADGGKSRLVGGFSPWLAEHQGTEGHTFCRYVRAAQEIAGPINGSERFRVEVYRYAVAGVVYERSSRLWAELVAKRDRGKGRRTLERQIERPARRLGLADFTLREATARLEALGAKRTPLSLAEQLSLERTTPERTASEHTTITTVGEPATAPEEPEQLFLLSLAEHLSQGQERHV